MPPAEAVVADEADQAEVIGLGPLDGLVGYHLRRASATLGSDYARSVEATGLRQVLFGVLSVISANPGINQGSVARVLGIQRPNMVAMVNALIERGLVARAVDASDRRAFALHLTDAGADALAHTLDHIREHEARMLEGMTAEERGLLVRLLGRIEAKAN